MCLLKLSVFFKNKIVHIKNSKIKRKIKGDKNNMQCE